MRREYSARVIVTSMSEEGDQPRPSLRDAEVAPPRKTLAEILEAAAGGARRLHHEGRARQGDLHRQGGRAAQPRAPVLPARRRATTATSCRCSTGSSPTSRRSITSNEKEALLLENTLIKQHQPRFNVKLRDDKNFLVLRLDPEAEWPRLEVVRQASATTAPTTSGPITRRPRAARRCAVVNRHFQLRTCTDHVLHNRAAPLPAVPDQALPRALRAAGVARGVRRAGARRAPVSRRQERRAAGAAAARA